MTVWQWLCSLYFWIPATIVMLLFKWCAVQERKLAEREQYRQDYRWNDED